ncbi:MAG TPA: vWA domain-containing protein [Candidatus Kapabacteria bacterium]|jgi:hypothetical protein|nr:vWA domain-containing protein [Candidatus Kapabacteria bacterium]
MKRGKWLATGVVLLFTFLYPLSLHAQPISITLIKPASGLLRVDSANWNEAWITLDGQSPSAKKLDTADLHVTDGEQFANVISVDSIGSRFSSHLALSFMLDNSGSMFHAYDSLTRMCDSILAVLPGGVVFQAVTFDNTARSESHIYTKRASVFIAQSGFRDSAKAVSAFWHFFDTIRSQYTPLYDAIATVITNIDDRRLGDSIVHDDVILVVTDGEDNASRASIEMLNELVSTAHVRLFAINFRTEVDERLRWLARNAKGEFYVAEDLRDLRELLRQIGSFLTRQYHVVYRFPSLTPSSGGK